MAVKQGLSKVSEPECPLTDNHEPQKIQSLDGTFLPAFMTLFMKVFMTKWGLFGQISGEGVGVGK